MAADAAAQKRFRCASSENRLADSLAGFFDLDTVSREGTKFSLVPLFMEQAAVRASKAYGDYVSGPRLIDLSLFSSPDRTLEAAVSECRLADGDPVLAVLSRD